MILTVHRLEVSVYNVCIANQFQITFARREVDPLVEVTVNSKEEHSFVPITSKNSVSVVAKVTFLIFLKSYYAVPGLCEPSVNLVRVGVSVINSLLHP
jgi:hypothetical protein